MSEDSPEDRRYLAGAVRLQNKTVVLIHPSWHSGGSHRVFCAQADAYRELGARVLSLAVSVGFRQNASNKAFWDEYLARTADLDVAERFVTGPTRSCIRSLAGWRRAGELVFGNISEQMIGNAELSPLPERLTARPSIDLVHCNFFYHMPLALRLKAMFGAPIVLDTHDIQAYQFELWRARSVYLRLRSSPAKLLKPELTYTAMADAIVHINADEYEFFASRLPEKKHLLLYPPAKLLSSDPHPRPYFLIVGSNHQGNYLSVAWFLENVYPLIPDIELKIVGRVDEIFRLRAPKTLERYRSLFIGRVDDLNPYYNGATAVLLPIVAGHGLSIKTVEAMSTGVPLVTLPLAFRGMRIDVAKLDNVWLANDAPGFARCMREAERWSLAQATGARRSGRDAARPESSSPAATRRAYEELFSFDAYLRGIASTAEMAAQNGSVAEGSIHPSPPNEKVEAFQ